MKIFIVTQTDGAKQTEIMGVALSQENADKMVERIHAADPFKAQFYPCDIDDYESDTMATDERDWVSILPAPGRPMSQNEAQAELASLDRQAQSIMEQIGNAHSAEVADMLLGDLAAVGRRRSEIEHLA